MTLIPFPQRQSAPHRHPGSQHQHRRPHQPAGPSLPLKRKAPVQGTFLSPSGQLGTMTGSMRLDRLILVSTRLYAAGFFTGELLDADGTVIGVASRRTTVPAELVRNQPRISAVIGPLEVDMLGLTVSIAPFALDLGLADAPDR